MKEKVDVNHYQMIIKNTYYRYFNDNIRSMKNDYHYYVSRFTGQWENVQYFVDKEF